ncbi:MAG: GatB/YqeY domain-containing protein [Patescibacteria group bacterium]|nr:GatB/YqeY domain-containing protein [Patescibacteria group bacterium]MCL5432176.1 GatB/YqeY domain-containing protein [Patescibacteria group bacterium]
MLLDQIQQELAQAQKNRDQTRVDTLRFLLGAIFNFQIEKGKDYVATDADVLSVVAKQVKTHKESIEMFTQAKRTDLVERESAQLAILQSYLPAQMSEEDIRSKIKDLKTQNQTADFPTLMKLAMGELRGKADGAIIAQITKEVLVASD